MSLSQTLLSTLAKARQLSACWHEDPRFVDDADLRRVQRQKMAHGLAEMILEDIESKTDLRVTRRKSFDVATFTVEEQVSFFAISVEDYQELIKTAQMIQRKLDWAELPPLYVEHKPCAECTARAAIAKAEGEV